MNRPTGRPRLIKPEALEGDVARTMTIVEGPVESKLIVERVTVDKGGGIKCDLTDWLLGKYEPILVDGVDF